MANEIKQIKLPNNTTYDLVDPGARELIAGKEDNSNKVTSISSSSTDTQYPSAKCVYDELENYVAKGSTNNVLATATV